MIIIPIKLSKEDEKIIKAYVKINNLDLSNFIRNIIINKIKEEYILEEKYLLETIEKNKHNEIYKHFELLDSLE
ncbi:DUF6290 family protein [Streptobacillus canis]|uniref:DUF6290 family protein n=1 Tax=Streptobacillus canis TaxID=2678686 RepID=UPI0012E24692|nr:DUF6290 family protein [Streptobacillus canis]